MLLLHEVSSQCLLIVLELVCGIAADSNSRIEPVTKRTDRARLCSSVSIDSAHPEGTCWSSLHTLRMHSSCSRRDSRPLALELSTESDHVRTTFAPEGDVRGRSGDVKGRLDRRGYSGSVRGCHSSSIRELARAFSIATDRVPSNASQATVKGRIRLGSEDEKRLERKTSRFSRFSMSLCPVREVTVAPLECMLNRSCNCGAAQTCTTRFHNLAWCCARMRISCARIHSRAMR